MVIRDLIFSVVSEIVKPEEKLSAIKFWPVESVSRLVNEINSAAVIPSEANELEKVKSVVNVKLALGAAVRTLAIAVTSDPVEIVPLIVWVPLMRLSKLAASDDEVSDEAKLEPFQIPEDNKFE